MTVRRVSVLKVPHSRGWRWRQAPVTAVTPVGLLKGPLKGFLKGFFKGLLVWRRTRWRVLVFRPPLALVESAFPAPEVVSPAPVVPSRGQRL